MYNNNNCSLKEQKNVFDSYLFLFNCGSSRFSYFKIKHIIHIKLTLLMF